jgi:hypothetical protein
VTRRLATVLVLVASAVAVSASNVAAPAARSKARQVTIKDEYVFLDRSIVVYDISNGYRQVDTIALPQLRGVRGVAGYVRTHMLFVSYGPDTDAGNGHLLAYDLVARRVVWDRVYPFGIDSMAVSRDGAKIYMPTGELSKGNAWKVLDAQNGTVIGTIAGGQGPHNTIVGPSGRWVYLGPRNDNYLYVASTASDRVVRRVGPLISGVRPFTINGRETIAYTTATGFLGFQVSGLKTRRVLFTVRIKGFSWNPSVFPASAPSHGIALSPGEKRLWVIDAPNSYVHVFDVSQVPRRPPRQIRDIRLRTPMTGNESPCSYDCFRDGWLQLSRDGRRLFVGDAGDVIDTRTLKVVAVLSALQNSRKSLEIWWRAGVPVYIGPRSSIGGALPKCSAAKC